MVAWAQYAPSSRLVRLSSMLQLPSLLAFFATCMQSFITPSSASKFINVGNDQPYVSIVLRACENPQNTLADLNFILPTSFNDPLDVPKTYVCVENIETGNETIEHLEALLRKRNALLANRGLIRPFNAIMSPEYRSAAMAAFRDK